MRRFHSTGSPSRWGIRIFDADGRLAAITAKGDPLEMIARVVPFESFRAEVEAAVLTPVSEKKSTAGRNPTSTKLARVATNRPAAGESADRHRARPLFGTHQVLYY
jgi:hypothetical protein